jgi:thiamine biosynthesis lipoprotein
MTTASLQAMGTTVVLHSNSELGIERATTVFEECEQRFSRFRPTSELSQINRCGERGVAVSNEMQRVLTAASDLCARTLGLVDIGVGGAVRDWGYETTFSEITDLLERPTVESHSRWRLEGNKVYLDMGTALDLGGIAKGWTADRVVEDGHVTVASAGGDVRSTDPTLVVEVLDGHDAVAAEVHIGIGALATSSRAKRRWTVASSEAHHIIDPRTMRPAASPIVSASVIAETAVEAEAGAKAVLILGAEGLKWADEQPWIRQAVAVWHDGTVYANALSVAS